MSTRNILSGLTDKLPFKASATVGVSWSAHAIADGSLIGGNVATATSGLKALVSVKPAK